MPGLSFDEYELPKLLFLTAITTVLSITSLTHRILHGKKFTFKRIPIEILLIGILAISQIISFVFSANIVSSLIGGPYRYQGIITELIFIALFANTYYLAAISKTKTTKSIFTWAFFIAIITSIIAIAPFHIDMQYFSPLDFKERAFGTLGNPNYLAVFLIGTLPLLALALREKSRIIKALAGISLPVILYGLFLTGSRSAWVGIICGLLFVGVLIIIKKRSYKILAIAIAMIAIIVGAVIFQQANPTRSLQRLSLEKEDLGGITTRIYLLESGTRLFTENPIIGSGQETITNNIEPYLPEYLKSNSLFFIDRTHNELLDILVTKGLLGLLAYLSFWIYIFWTNIRRYFASSTSSTNEPLILALLCGMLAIHTYYFMNFATISGNILLLIYAGYLTGRK